MRLSPRCLGPVAVAWLLLAAPALGAVSAAVEVRGNRNSKIYHVPGCRNYDDIALGNRVIFKTEAEAVAAGYRRAGNCR